MSLSSYVKAVMPDDYTILGIVLRPFSLGHYQILARYHSPFVADESARVDLENKEMVVHFLFALAACSRTFEGFNEFIHDKKMFESEMRLWNRIIRKQIKEDSDFNLVIKMMTFQKYLSEAFTFPGWQNNRDATIPLGQTPAKHWVQQIFEDLVSAGNRTESEVRNKHLPEAFNAWLHLKEQEGLASLLTDEQMALIDSKATVQISDWDRLVSAQKGKNA